MGKRLLPIIIITVAILLPGIIVGTWVGYYVAHHQKHGAPTIHVPRPYSAPRVAWVAAYASA